MVVIYSAGVTLRKDVQTCGLFDAPVVSGNGGRPERVPQGLPFGRVFSTVVVVGWYSERRGWLVCLKGSGLDCEREQSGLSSVRLENQLLGWMGDAYLVG